MPFLQCRDLPPLVPDKPNEESATGLDDRVAHEEFVKELFEQMCQEFADRGYDAHLLIVPPRSSRVMAQAMTRFKTLHEDTWVMFNACHDETDVTEGHFVFFRKSLF